MSSSFFVNTTCKIYKVLDGYFENSFLYKILCKIGSLSKNSSIVNCVTNIISKKNDKGIKENSIVINSISKFLTFINSVFLSVYNYLALKNQNSILLNFTKNFFMPLNNLGKALNAFCFIGIGFFATKLIYMAVKYGFSGNIILINGAAFLVMICISFLDIQKLDNMIKNNMIAKLIKWFFVS